MTESNIKELIKAIEDFGFGGLNLEPLDFMNPENIIQLGYEPYRIDLLVDINGISFEDCFNRRVKAKLDGTQVNFLSLHDLIRSKKLAGRLQDLADAEQLEKINKKKKN